MGNAERPVDKQKDRPAGGSIRSSHALCFEACLCLFMGVGVQVFAQTHIPRALEEVVNHEEDYDRLASGRDTEGIYYQTITGMKQDMSGAREGPATAAVQVESVSDNLYLIVNCKQGSAGKRSGSGIGLASSIELAVSNARVKYMGDTVKFLTPV